MIPSHSSPPQELRVCIEIFFVREAPQAQFENSALAVTIRQTIFTRAWPLVPYS